MASVDKKKLLDQMFSELEKEAYVLHSHTYRYKQANQIVRKHMGRVIDVLEGIQAMAHNPKIKGTTKMGEINKMLNSLNL